MYSIRFDFALFYIIRFRVLHIFRMNFYYFSFHVAKKKTFSRCGNGIDSSAVPRNPTLGGGAGMKSYAFPLTVFPGKFITISTVRKLYFSRYAEKCSRRKTLIASVCSSYLLTRILFRRDLFTRYFFDSNSRRTLQEKCVRESKEQGVLPEIDIFFS